MRYRTIAALILLFIACVLAGCTVILQGAEPEPSPRKERGVNHELQTFEGVYQGMADNNFFEVQKEDTDECKVFMITEDMRADFESMELLKGDPVRVEYTENSYGQLETILLERRAEAEPPAD